MSAYLFNKCGMCYVSYPKNEVVVFSCGCALCDEDFNEWFIKIVTRNVEDWRCPLCKPTDHLSRQRMALHLNVLNKIVQSRESGCGYGMLVECDVQSFCCVSCRKSTCRNCRQLWVPLHRGRSCEEFQMATNEDLRSLMKNSGVFCPKCKSPCDIAPGGCLHTDCVHCGHSYCTGCRCKMYMTYELCDRADHVGHDTHGHHSRNCNFYLRNWQIQTLKDLLASKNIDYKKKVTSDHPDQLCTVLIIVNNEEVTCARDEYECQMCEQHFKSFLIKLINMHNLDPLPFMENEEVQRYFSHNHFKKLAAPKQMKGESDVDYYTRLRQNIMIEFPLPKLK